MTDRGVFALAVGLYGVSTLYSVFLYRSGFRRDRWAVYLLLLAGMVLHTIAMAQRGFSFSRCPVTNLYEATAFTGWTIVTATLALGLVRRFRFVGAFAAPLLFCLGVFALMPQLDVHGPQPQFTHSLSSLHASLTLLAYGAFGIGAVAAVMFLAQQRDLKQRRSRALAFLPSIERLDTVAARALALGLALLSIGLGLGSVWLKHEKGVYFSPDAKVLWACGVWLAYVALVFARWRLACGGRQFAWGALGTFAFLVLTFWASNLLSGIHNP